MIHIAVKTQAAAAENGHVGRSVRWGSGIDGLRLWSIGRLRRTAGLWAGASALAIMSGEASGRCVGFGFIGRVPPRSTTVYDRL